jgi:hypothetical protein
MKSLKNIVVLFFLGLSTILSAQETKKVIHEALELEMSRNLKNLQLEGMKTPFFIGTNIIDANNIFINSSLGNVITFRETPSRFIGPNQVLVGSYADNNLNFSSSGSNIPQGMTLPLDNSSTELRRSLWMKYDKLYKTSAEQYEAKQSAIKSKPQDEDIIGLEDYTPGVKVIVDKPEMVLAFNTSKIIQYVNEISLAFKDYPSLTSSSVSLEGANSNVYYQNTEGTKASYPMSGIRITIEAEAQASNGEILRLFKNFFYLNESSLPSSEQFIINVKNMSALLMELKEAPVFDEVYNGPVLFEGDFEQMFFSPIMDGLFSVRKQVTGNNRNISQSNISSDDRLDKKISHECLQMTAKPLMTTFEGQPLLGSYPIDMEGTIPPESIVLVENGVLKTQMCGRTPTRKIKQSNGHSRGIISPSFSMSRTFPSVIDIEFKDASTREELRNKLIEMAEEEGLDFAMIVRDMYLIGNELKLVYKLDLKTGNETMMRTAGFKPFNFSDLRKLVGASDHKRVYNMSTLTTGVSFITPDALLFKDLEVNKVSKTNLTNFPVVKNPLGL